jgi:hypothetical protein
MPRRLCDSAISCALPPYNLRWSAAATRLPHSRCERWSVCLRIDRGPIVRSSVCCGTYLMTLISTKPWGSHRIPASRSDHIQRDVDSMNLRSSIAHRGDVRGPPTAAQDHRFEADPACARIFVACEILSQLRRVMDDPRFLLAGECEPLSAGGRVRIYARRGPYVCIYPEDTITPCK